jgi:hypothetical protein
MEVEEREKKRGIREGNGKEGDGEGGRKKDTGRM